MKQQRQGGEQPSDPREGVWVLLLVVLLGLLFTCFIGLATNASVRRR